MTWGTIVEGMRLSFVRNGWVTQYVFDGSGWIPAVLVILCI